MLLPAPDWHPERLQGNGLNRVTHELQRVLTLGHTPDDPVANLDDEDVDDDLYPPTSIYTWNPNTDGYTIGF